MKRIFPLVLLLPAPLFAQEGNESIYNYFDINYLGTDWDLNPGSLDGNGYSARFSVAIRDHVYLAGDYTAWDFDGVPSGSTTASVGVGTNWNLSPKWSVFGIAGYRSLDLDMGLGNMEEEAGFISGGVRWQAADGFELRISGDYSDLTPVRSGESSVTIGGDIFLTEVVALTIEFNENDDNATTAMIGLRFYHDRESSGLRKRR